MMKRSGKRKREGASGKQEVGGNIFRLMEIEVEFSGYRLFRVRQIAPILSLN
ncbi:MAG: hypothetical protein HQL67_05290 [Magnetococcales bacterium]|nr:hypothetical protein [Magnetococcales bacterium]